MLPRLACLDANKTTQVTIDHRRGIGAGTVQNVRLPALIIMSSKRGAERRSH